MDTQRQTQTKTSSQPSSNPQQSWFQQRPFSDSPQLSGVASEEELLQASAQPPNLQPQLDRTTRFDYSFSRVQVSDNAPAIVQPQRLATQPTEQYEEEIEPVAQPVKLMAPPSSFRQNHLEEVASSPSSVSLITPTVQRQEEDGGWMKSNPLITGIPLQRQEQEELVQPQLLSSFFTSIQRQEEDPEDLDALTVQPKLVVGAPGDRYEQEADQMAAQVMSMSAPPANSVPIQRQEEEQEQEPLVQRSSLADSITPLLQRQTEEQEEPLQTKSLLQRAGNGNAEAGSHVENQLNESKGGGIPLPDEVRSFMEPRFGVDFSAVRAHTDSSAIQMNKDLHAQAFTHGSDIYYGSGKSPAQDSLTAHELTHVVQQTGAKKLQQKPNPTRTENKNTIQAKELRQQPTEQEKETLQAKELSGYSSGMGINKELRRQLLSKEQGNATIQAKRISEDSQEVNPDLNKESPDAITKTTSEKTVSDTKPQTEAGKETGSPTQHQPPEITAVNAPRSAIVEPESATSEAKTKLTPEPAIAGSLESKGSKDTSAVQSSSQGLPLPKEGDVLGAKAVPPAKPLEAAQNAQAENASPAQVTPEATVAAAAPPSLDFGGGSAEELSETGSGGGEEAEIEAAAAEAPPGSGELEAGERDAALASVAEGSGGGSEAVGGGGGAGAAIADKPTPPVPEVSQSEPSAAMAAVSKLPPAQLMAALGSVGAAVGNSVGKERAELAANPPQMESPSGSPKTNQESAADREPPKGKDAKGVEKAPEGQAKPVPQPKPLPTPPAPPTAAVPQPQVKGDAEGKLDAGGVEQLKASLRRIPTSDPGFKPSVGTSPSLELQGDADPQRAQEQRANLEKSVADAHSKGKEDLAQPMGENEIYPKVQQETLRAEAIGGGAAAGGAALKVGGAAAAGGAAGEDAVSIIAQQEKGQEIQAAMAQAQAEMGAKRQEHAAKVAEEKARSNEEIGKLQQENTAQQAEERAKAQTEVGQMRSDWQKEQDGLVEKSRKEADEAVSKGAKDIENEQTQGEAKAAEHIKKGEEEAATARTQGEEEAERERQKGEQDSGGIFGWLADKAKAFFDGIKQAIQKAFEVARAAVKAAIEGAQKLATAVIETARKAIVGLIKVVGQALIAIGDVLLAAFPGLRDRFRNAIKGVVKAAEAAVNALADTLKKGVQAALNLLGKGLDAALGLMEKGMLAAVDIANKAVQGAIKFADAAIKAIGAFAVLAKDIAGNPGQWLSNLGAGAMDGIKNHFWGPFQTAVKEWFSQKVEEVLGLGMTMWNVLKQGGINVAEVGKMAWEGIKSSIPAVLIGILIEKVVSMIVPAAGTVLLIIEGLQAAWGTASRVLQAFERFMAFLKAVKTGQAGPPFGAAVAAAGVVVIDFVSNWLLKRLRGPASKVAGKIREIASKIGKKIKKAVKKLGKKFGKVRDKFFGKKGGKGDKNKGREGDRKNKDKKGKEDKEHTDPQHDAKVAKGLRQIDIEEVRYLKHGAITQKDAEKVAAKVKRENPIFKSITVINGGSTWDYAYVASKGIKKGETQQEKIEKVRNEIREKLKSPLLKPGSHAKESIPASSPYTVPAADQREVNRIGNLYGCHHTGAKSPGQAEWTGDHQPVTKLVEAAQQQEELMKLMQEAGLATTLSGQQLYPHSFAAYKSQGGTITAILLKLKKLERLKGDK